MSEEKKVEQIEQDAPELTEQDLDHVAGGKQYLESRSNISNTPVKPVPVPPKPAGTPAM